MSLDKAIEHGKEKRKPYRGSKAIDHTCRNHGGCDWCLANRQYSVLKRKSAMKQEEDEYERRHNQPQGGDGCTLQGGM